MTDLDEQPRESRDELRRERGLSSSETETLVQYETEVPANDLQEWAKTTPAWMIAQLLSV